MATGSQDDACPNWKATLSALNVLEPLLRCKICMELFRNPMTLNVCGHTFCYICCHPVASIDACHCPECGVPVWMRELTPNTQLNNIVGALTNIKAAISNRPPGLTGTSTINGCEGDQETLRDLLDVINAEQVDADGRERQPTVLVSEVTAVGGCESDMVKRRVRRNASTRRQCESHCLHGSHASHAAGGRGNQAVRRTSRRKCSGNSARKENTDILGVCSSSRERHTLSSAGAQQDVLVSSVGHRDLSNGSHSQSDVETLVSGDPCDATTLKDMWASRSTVVQPDKCASKEVSAGCSEAIFIGGTPAIKGAKCNDKMLPRCANGHSKGVQGKRNFKGETPLHTSAIKGDEALAETLLRLGADPNAKDHAGWTPLHDASYHGRASVVSLLLDNGAFINVPGFDNNTALHEAVASSSGEVTSLLLRRGALTTLRNSQGKIARVLNEYKWLDEIFNQVSPDCEQVIGRPILKNIHASPELNGGLDRVVLIGTGLQQCQKVLMTKVASLLNAEVTETFSNKVSHVIANCEMDGVCLRTYKLLCGIATGKWIVGFEWISRCFSERKWEDETPYEVCSVMTVDSPCTSAACKQARENGLFGAPGLFDGCHFYLHGSFSPSQPSKEELCFLIQSSQGSLLLREPNLNIDFETRSFPYHAKSGHTCNAYVLFDPTNHDLREKEKLKDLSKKNSSVAVVPIGWIIDCLTNFQLLPVPL